jgi:hypothetical protein
MAWKFYVREKEKLNYISSRLEGKMDKKAYRISANSGWPFIALFLCCFCA